jgi:hypothetical protein
VNTQRCLYAGGIFIQAGSQAALRAAHWPDNYQTVTGTVHINGGAEFANTTSVTLTLAGNQIARMQFSNDGDQAGNLESFPSRDGSTQTRVLDCPYNVFSPLIFKSGFSGRCRFITTGPFYRRR